MYVYCTCMYVGNKSNFKLSCIAFVVPTGLFFSPLLSIFFFFFRKNTYCYRTRHLSVRPSRRLSIRLYVHQSHVEIISFRGNWISNRTIDLKIGLNAR